MPQSRPEVRTVQQAIDSGLLDLSYHINEVLANRSERIDFLREVYPSMSITSRQAALARVRDIYLESTDWQQFGNTPSNRDIPIMSTLPAGTRTYQVWVKVTVTFREGAGDQYPVGTRSTITRVTQTGSLDLNTATMNSLDQAISQIAGDDTPYGVSHGDVYTEVSYEIMAIGRSNFGSQ